ncbi:rCG21589, isoform CRA_a [Rattus norvegicus]|uniref:RCG21589, isoform CRA_a n=1 Tax=Rattus norvegicus TaxID=10116 RepID=A6J277_RAT|nr:rCG21589, isoform CRA_a [Rattus norvegicus]
MPPGSGLFSSTWLPATIREVPDAEDLPWRIADTRTFMSSPREKTPH